MQQQQDPYERFRESLAQAVQNKKSVSSFAVDLDKIQYELIPDGYTRNGRPVVIRERLRNNCFALLVHDIDNSKNDVQKDYSIVFTYQEEARLNSSQAMEVAKTLINKYKIFQPALGGAEGAGGAGNAQGGARAFNEMDRIMNAEMNTGKAKTAFLQSRSRVMEVRAKVNAARAALESTEAELRAAEAALANDERALDKANKDHEDAVAAFEDRKRKRE